MTTTDSPRAELLSKLAEHHSWKLEKISHTTYPRDIVVKLNYLTPDQTEAIAGMIKGGTCFRCRIAKGRYWFAASMTEAIRLALENTPAAKAQATKAGKP